LASIRGGLSRGKDAHSTTSQADQNEVKLLFCAHRSQSPSRRFTGTSELPILARENFPSSNRGNSIRQNVRTKSACQSESQEADKERPRKCTQRRSVRKGDAPKMGDQWVYVAIDAETKLIPSFRIGKRVRPDTWAFLTDLYNRLDTRRQLTTEH
jgi:hypothetical protein